MGRAVERPPFLLSVMLLVMLSVGLYLPISHCVSIEENRDFSRFLVEVTGFEPAAFWSRTKRATKLRYTSAYGANEGTRTLDLRFTKPLLYQLSYVGVPLERDPSRRRLS